MACVKGGLLIDKSADKTIDAFLASEAKLLDRIEVLEGALREIDVIYKNTFNTKNEIDWKTLAETVYQFDEIATKALWPT
jgi:hypothetical protein